ncbi:HNH endonuclease signature motif containing protein [Streptacidiphilus carbonis]|uniref:HNH endonuclease signature motif containing protein n=1 Tax=Streptacidiphilus carbonis TaxID=105422 RepID=UPI00126991E0|nr:HNH endonuclease signature motif containing protein [Streptacidiphilus carbonis]
MRIFVKVERKKISAEVRRHVRQRCHFGCVICGLPLYEYDHMFDYAVTGTHKEEELTLLCDRHHSEKTKKLLPRETVIAANKAPFNKTHDVSEPYGFHFSGSRCEFVLGGNNRFLASKARLVPILVNGDEVLVFDFRDGHLLLSAMIRDRNGQKILSIEENELTYSSGTWDIDFVGRELTLRNGLRDFQFQATFETPGRVVVSRLDIRYGDVRVYVDPKGIHVRGPGERSRDLSSVTMLGGFEHAVVLDSHGVRAAGLIL